MSSSKEPVWVKAEKDSVWAAEAVREFRLRCTQHGSFGTVPVPGDSRHVEDWKAFCAAEEAADKMAAVHALRHARRFRRGWLPLGHYVTARCTVAGEPQMAPADLARKVLGTPTRVQHLPGMVHRRAAGAGVPVPGRAAGAAGMVAGCAAA